MLQESYSGWENPIFHSSYSVRIFLFKQSCTNTSLYIHTHTHTYIYIYIYIERERDRDRDRDTETETETETETDLYTYSRNQRDVFLAWSLLPFYKKMCNWCHEFCTRFAFRCPLLLFTTNMETASQPADWSNIVTYQFSATRLSKTQFHTVPCFVLLELNNEGSVNLMLFNWHLKQSYYFPRDNE